MALLFPACYLLKNSLALLAAGDMTAQIGLTGLSTLLLFAGFPTLVTLWGSVDFRSTFALRWPSWLAWPAAMIAGVSLWPFAHELVVGLSELGLVPLQLAQLEAAEKIIAATRLVPLGLVLGTFAIFPAIAEEWCFRGYLYRALETRLPGWHCALVSGVIFGLFHLVAVDALAIERLAPTTLLGCILGWIRWRTGSIGPGIIVHVCHNGLLTLAFYYQSVLKSWKLDLATESHLPRLWLLGAAVLVLLAGAGFQWGVRKPAPMSTSIDPL